MQIVTLARDYLLWHYSAAYGDIVGITRNFLWFVVHAFSVTDMLRSLFAPFRRLKEEPVRFLKSPNDFLANLTVNAIMRIAGLFIRTAFILIALFLSVALIFFCVLLILLWTILPALVAYLFVSGILSLAS